MEGLDKEKFLAEMKAKAEADKKRQEEEDARKVTADFKMEKLKPNFLYRIKARNAYLGVWMPEKQGFVILRNKFGSEYPFVEYHWDTGAPYGTVVPEEELIKFPIDVQGEFDESKFHELMTQYHEQYKPV